MRANAPANDEYWINHQDYSFAGGTGTEDDPYLIETPGQLAHVSSNNYYYYKQIADIDMSMYWWSPIGSLNSPFSGNYNGNNYIISGLYIKSASNNGQGLFGCVEGSYSNPTEIIGVGIINSIIQGYNYVGGIVGNASDYVNITNCYNICDVTGNVYVGGIIGGANTNVNITDCYNTGDISGTGSVGGIVGDGDGALRNMYITNCYNTGNVSGSGNYVGGIAGQFTCRGEYIIKMTNCYNAGSVLGEEDYVGGLVGYTNNYITVVGCYNTGEVLGVGGYVGGIAGQFRGKRNDETIINCYNTGGVTGGNNVGGIVGYIDQSSIVNSYNKGYVTCGESDAGGIAGGSWNTIINNCYSAGDVTGGNNIGALVGDATYTTTNDCYKGVNCVLNATYGSYSASTIDVSSCTIENVTNIDWYTSRLNWSSDYPWDFENTWGIDPSMNDGYPILMPTLEIMQFTITYHPNGASGSEVVESKVGSASYTIRSNMFTRSGYRFTGWNTQANGGGVSYSAGASYSELANLDLYAQWSRITYTIKYNKNASDATGTMANTTKYYGTNVTLRSNAFKRTGYSFAGWATSANGDVMYSNGATYTANANVTLYAKWDPHKYTIVFNGNGSTSGSMKEQTFEYGKEQKLTSNAFKKTGFTFSKWTRNADGTGTSYTNGQSVKNLTSTDGAEINLWAQWKARNEAKYDSAGKYWYVENGKIPQTKVTNSTLISNLNKATTNGSNYYIAGQTLTAKVYSGKEYCKWNNNWYEVEPIKWRLDASSSQKDGYGTTTDTNAVLAEIVYVDQYSSSSIDAGEGYSNQSVTDFMRNGISTTYLVNYATSTQTFGTGTSLYGTNASTTARMFVSSQSEITAVNGDLTITFSDLVEDMIKYYGGTNVYFTRDLGSNYNNIVCFNEVGREVQRFATDYRGVQFTVRFTEYGCVA